MSRLKQDYDKKLNRKHQRHSNFDAARDIDNLLSERDSLRELTKSFRHVLAELAKCVVSCEDDLNVTLAEEVHRLLNQNRSLNETQLDESELNLSLNASMKRQLMPDVSSLLEVVENPSLLMYISRSNSELEDFDLSECLARLKTEAAYLLQLSEHLGKRPVRRNSECSSGAEKNDSCCEQEEYQANLVMKRSKFLRAQSLNEQQLISSKCNANLNNSKPLNSLPLNFNKDEDNCTASELNFQLHELRNRLVKSEDDRQKLQQELENTIARNAELGNELQSLRDQLSQLNSLNHTEYAEGYGMLGATSPKSPQRRLTSSEKSSSSFALLQEKARNLLSTPTHASTLAQESNNSSTHSVHNNNNNKNDSTVLLLQMIEDFCREGDKVVDCNKKDREDLQAQIDTADKQLKATRHFLEEQAAEREQERDEFLREIERLKSQLRDKEKERSSFVNASEEVEHLEAQIRDLTSKLNDSNGKRDKFEVELKASIDKIFVLREIISELETQIETKSLNEHVLGEKIKVLEDFVNSQTRSNDALQYEVLSLKTEIGEGYQERIRVLEEKLQNIRPPAEQSMVLDQVVEQLRDIENTLEHKTKTLESLHYSNSSNSCSEDLSHDARPPTLTVTNALTTTPQLGSPMHPSPRQHSLTMEGVQRILDKLSKHSRVEEAAIKRIKDLEMQVNQIRGACVELQHERETLQERMAEQTQRISALQLRLEEQRQRAEELQRAGTADLNIRIHDLQNEVQNQKETITARDKQIANFKTQMEKSKVAIDRLEAELAVVHNPDRSVIERLEREVAQKADEIQKLKNKIKTEMINRLALPDLMETMLADKNEEIDHLKEQLDQKEKQLKNALDLSGGSPNSFSFKVPKMEEAAAGEVGNKLSARTLSDIVSLSDFDEPDVVRRAVQQMETPLVVPSDAIVPNSLETSKEVAPHLTSKHSQDLSGFATLNPVNTFEHPHYFQDPHAPVTSMNSANTTTPGNLIPRQINFSAFTDDSRLKTPHLTQTPQTPQSTQTSLDNNENLLELQQKLMEKEADLSLQTQKVAELQQELRDSQSRLEALQQQLQQKQQAFETEISTAKSENARLISENKQQKETLDKQQKEIINLQAAEEALQKRLKELEQSILDNVQSEVMQKESLRKELHSLSLAHEQCKHVRHDAEQRKQEVENLNKQLKLKEEFLQQKNAQLEFGAQKMQLLHQQVENLEAEVERLKQQQAQSDNSSKQFSVDEIAQQVEKELNYSAQLDSSILRAIESEEENNLDLKRAEKNSADPKTEAQGTDDENFTGERDLLNQLEALKAQLTVEREQNSHIKEELLTEKHHSQEIQEQDVLIIEAMRKRLEAVLLQEDELHKQLDMERERCERIQTQLTALQRAESRRNSALLLKSPNESPRKSPRSLGANDNLESELTERLKGELKILGSANEREKERSADLQRNAERERQRYDNELRERVEYCDRLKHEMDKLLRDKDSAEIQNEHLQERLTLQTAEIESLECRLATLQEAETRRTLRRERQQAENSQLQTEMAELRSKLLSAESERDHLQKSLTQIHFELKTATQREEKLADALRSANEKLATESAVPQQFMAKMKEINALLTENTQENRQMAETVQFLVEERRQLQKKCDDLEQMLGNSANIQELEEKCQQLFGRYLRVESHRKALVYQKRYLKLTLMEFQLNEQRARAAMQQPQLVNKPKNRFKTAALAIVAIQRLKYIQRTWQTGKRIVNKSIFTVIQQKRPQPSISCNTISSSSPPTNMPNYSGPTSPQSPQYQQVQYPFRNPTMPRQLTALQAPYMVADYAAASTSNRPKPQQQQQQQSQQH